MLPLLLIKGNLSLKEALTSYYEITVLTKKFIQQAAEIIEMKAARACRSGNADQLKRISLAAT
ncbi:hypothetical protein PO124_24390 [Bacillus licheniformis]|nr:hypothetical protein [Bacillus licheniformis]